MWALDLLAGNNCLGLNLRSVTIKEYLEAAQDLMVEGGYDSTWKATHGLPLDDTNNCHTSPVMANLKRWEEIPDRREMFTDDMLEEFYKRKTSARKDSLEDCFFDWLALSRYTAFRRGEWAQTRKHTYERVSEDNLDARAMIDMDFVFFNINGHLLNKLTADINEVYRIDVTWRFQKNGNNGETISFWRDDLDPRWCPVRAAWRICQRVRRLNQPLHEPLAKYVDHKTNRIAYMNSSECERYMRDVAKGATGITDEKLLQKMFGMHSFRVTACNELARLGVADSFIQRRLRWTSTAFLMYLRNSVYTARRHNLSLSLRVNPQDRELQRNMHSHNRRGSNQ
jgi:hypothetical protein